MRVLALTLVVLAGCATMDPRSVSQNRRDMSAPVIGCAPADTVITSASPEATVWQARCSDRVYDCRGELVSNGMFGQRFALICDPAKK